MGDPESHLSQATLSESKATQDLGVPGQKVLGWPLSPACQAHDHLGGPCVSRKRSPIDSNWAWEQSMHTTLDGSFWTHGTRQGRSFFSCYIKTYINSLHLAHLNQQSLNTYLVLYKKSLPASALRLEQLQPIHWELAHTWVITRHLTVKNWSLMVTTCCLQP